MKVVFFFMSKGNASPGEVKDDSWKRQKASPVYEATFKDECYFKFLEDLVAAGIIDELDVYFESNVGPGKVNFVKGANCFVVPDINLVFDTIKEGNVIFVRGGFRHWHDLLETRKGKNWLILYAANTGRARWGFWDIIFDDLEMSNRIDQSGRYFFPFIKPTNEDVFHTVSHGFSPIYDICIGASHIHDKKGQYHAINLMKVFHSEYGYYPSAIMPGSIRSSTETKKMIRENVYLNEIVCPGMVSKQKLSEIFNSSRLFLHLGNGGQNDRSILEAYSCGCQIGIRNLPSHTPLLIPDEETIFHFDIDNDPGYKKSAYKLFHILEVWNLNKRYVSETKYRKDMGYDEVVLPALKELFRIIKYELKSLPFPTIQAKEHMQRFFENFSKRRNK